MEQQDNLKPWMDQIEIETVQKLLVSLEKQHLEILEWGCGGSTEYFTQFLREQNISYHWTSIEHNPEWFHKIAKRLENDTKIEMHLFELVSPDSSEEDVCKQEYITFPASLQKRFDFILVDGRQRARCLEQASQLINPNGIVMLHDASRRKYYSAFHRYPNSKFLRPRIWIAINQPINWLGRVKSILNYNYYRWIVRRLYRLGIVSR